MSQLDVSIVLPVYNEGGHLHEEIERVRKTMDESGHTYEIIVVDDGSTDGSSEMLREVEGIRLLQFPVNHGCGFARRWGTLEARGRVVVWSDVDMSYPNDEIPALVADLHGYDQVVGARRTEGGTVRWLRGPAKWFIRKMASYLTGVRIPDLNSGFRAMRTDVARQFVHMLPNGFSCVTTITMAFLTNGYSVRYVPIDYFPRAGESKFHWWKDTRRYVLQVVRMALLWEPLRVFGPLAAVFGVVGVGKLVFDLFDKGFRVATNTLVVLGVAAAITVVGMLADLLVRSTAAPLSVAPTVLDSEPRL